MRDLVTLADAYSHLRLDFDSSGSADDDWLAVMIPAVSEAVALWVKDESRLYVPELDTDGNPVVDSDGNTVAAIDSNGQMTVRPAVRAAALIELSSQYRFREGEGTENVVPPDAGHGFVLNKVSTALLAPLRRSTVA